MKFRNLLKIIIAILCGFLIGAICLNMVGIEVSRAYGKLLNAMFGSPKNVINCFIYTTPYLLTSLAFCISVKGGIFNMGVEGEFIVSSLLSCVTGIIFKDLHPIILIPLCVTSGIIASIIFSTIIYYLKTHLNIHEIFAMIIMNYIALHLSNFVINMPTLKSDGGAETTKLISDNAIICMNVQNATKLGLPANMNFSFIVAVILSFIVYFIFKYTKIGHNIENLGLNNEASIRSGIEINKTIFCTMLLSSILAGFAGSIYMISIGKRLSLLPQFEGYGFTGILVSLLAGNNPLTIIPSSIFFGALKYAGRSLNIVNAPSQIIDLITSSIILIIGTNFYFKKRKR